MTLLADLFGDSFGQHQSGMTKNRERLGREPEVRPKLRTAMRAITASQIGIVS